MAMSNVRAKHMRMLYSRVQTILRRRLQKGTLEISAPVDFQIQPICIPGVSEDEIFMLREKAAASRIGVAETMQFSPAYTSSSCPRSGPTASILPPYDAVLNRGGQDYFAAAERREDLYY